MKNNAQNNKSVFDKGLHKLFYNNKYLAVFSFVMAIILWAIVVMEFSPETTYVIKDVPVSINVENTTAERLGLQHFVDKTFKVDVTIKGKRYAINKKELLPTDITVTANLNSVDSVGTHTLQLVAVKNDRSADFEIISLSKEEISVFFDVYKEIEIDLKSQALPTGLVAEGYFSNGAFVSPETILVGGPATQIDLIDRENIYAKFDTKALEGKSPIEKTTPFNAKIDLVDAYGNVLNFVEIKEEKMPSIIVPVMKLAEFETSVEFSKTPDNYKTYIKSITINPQTINISAPADSISSMVNVSVGTIDFSKLNEGKNEFTFSKEQIQAGVTVLDELNEITVTVELGDIDSKTVNINKSQISFSNKPDGYDVKLVEGSSTINGVTIYGPAEEIEKITSDSLHVAVNLSDYNEGAGTKNVTVDISINNNKCWVYGVYELPIEVIKTK